MKVSLIFDTISELKALQVTKFNVSLIIIIILLFS